MSGHVYFIECAGRIKIGYSGDVNGRLRSLATASPHPTVLLGIVAGSIELERSLHRRAAAYRVKGEWFTDCEDVRALVASALAEGETLIPAKPPRSPPRHLPEIPIRSSAPKLSMKPIYLRFDACVTRYVGEGVLAAVEREKRAGLAKGTITNKVIGGYYSGERAGYAIAMMNHTLDCLGKGVDVLLESAIDDPEPMAAADLVPRANELITRLENGLHRLFENPDVSVIDLSAYPQLAAA